jgi:hypothetical protein
MSKRTLESSAVFIDRGLGRSHQLVDGTEAEFFIPGAQVAVPFVKLHLGLGLLQQQAAGNHFDFDPCPGLQAQLLAHAFGQGDLPAFL